ncbi:aminopeptidase P family N-terminal domain-containing protein, partial [Candidatus Peregrinibacteria bacterium]|nr:aminopeptidase P family N-terminal domain-containing protein [Candidatus Peregrinibacteria bacterium]
MTDKSNIKYLSNFSGSSGFMLIAKNTSSRTSEKLSEVLYLFTDSRYMEGAKSIIKKGVKLIDITRVWKSETLLRKSWQSLLKKHRIKILGVEESNLTMARFKKFKKISKGTKILFKDASGEIEKQREIKNKEEINLTIRSQKINEQVLTEIKKIIQNFLIGKSSEKFIKECPAYGESRLKLGNPPTAGALTEKYLAWKIKELSH